MSVMPRIGFWTATHAVLERCVCVKHRAANAARISYIDRAHYFSDSVSAVRMSTQDYRPPRKSAVFEDNGVSNEIAGDDPGAQLQPAAPPAHGGRRPMPKPRNPKPLPPMGPAPTPHFVEPGPYLQDPAGPAPTPQQLRGDGQALPPHVIGHNPPLPGTAPPLYNYQQPGGPPPPPYQLQPGAPANPLERSGVGAQNEKKRGPADFRVRVQGSYMFCTTWRGIIEIIARAAVMVSSSLLSMQRSI